MAAITVNQGSNTGVTPLTFASIGAGGDTLANNGRTLLIFRETAGAGTTTVTADSPALVNGLTIQNPTVVVPSSGYAEIGPFDPAVFNTAAGVTSLTYAGAGVATTEVTAISA